MCVRFIDAKNSLSWNRKRCSEKVKPLFASPGPSNASQISIVFEACSVITSREIFHSRERHSSARSQYELHISISYCKADLLPICFQGTLHYFYRFWHTVRNNASLLSIFFQSFVKSLVTRSIVVQNFCHFILTLNSKCAIIKKRCNLSLFPVNGENMFADFSSLSHQLRSHGSTSGRYRES